MHLIVMCFDDGLHARGGAQPECDANAHSSTCSNPIANSNARGEADDFNHLNLSANTDANTGGARPERLEELVRDPAS